MNFVGTTVFNIKKTNNATNTSRVSYLYILNKGKGRKKMGLGLKHFS